MIFISAGHHKADPGAIGVNGLKEADLAIIQRDLTIKELNFLGVKPVKDLDSETLGQYLARIKTGSGSVVLEYHFNAANGKASGVETLIEEEATQEDLNFAKELTDITAKILGIPNRGVKKESQSHRGRLGLMREEGIIGLMELGFIDNPVDVKSWQANKEKVAKEHAKILVKYENLIK